MIAVLLSVIFPGLGQFYYGKWVRASLMLVGGLTPLYPITLVWSVIDAYRLSCQGVTPRFSGKEAITVILLVFVVAPLCMLGLVVATGHTVAWLKDAHLNRSATVTEGAEIAAALVEYRGEFGQFPDTLTVIIGTRPLRSGWLSDGWGRPYRYNLEASGDSFRLVSAGRDAEFGTEDDLEWRP